ncbi:MAG: heavy metal-binding domain-containing protein, partial [Desulforhopalus sp.]
MTVTDKKRNTENMEYKDPVCGMKTDKEDEFIHYEHEEKSYYFCSEHCLKKFKDSPASYSQSSRHSGGAGDSEKESVEAQDSSRQYTCPMHPEIIEDGPGSCPKCGMALEPMTVTLEDEEDNSEYDDMRRRFIFAAIFTLPLMVIAMRDMLPGGHLIENVASVKALGWTELILATPVVLWAGWIFLVRAVQSLQNRNLNMFTLIGLGVSFAYFYSV